MYHVTNVSVDTSPKHPDWRTIEPNVANDTVYSGSLLGLPVVFFTTTLYKISFLTDHLIQKVLQQV